MRKSLYSYTTTIFFLILNINLSAQHVHLPVEKNPGDQLQFIENKGQWTAPALYKATLGGLNSLFLENHALTYVFHDSKQVARLHDAFYQTRENYNINGHAFKVHFVGASRNTSIKELEELPTRYSYFLGKEESNWISDVKAFQKIRHENLYNYIHLESYSDGNNFKYDFIITPGGDPSQIQLFYEDATSLEIKRGDLIIGTSVETVHELKPVAWQIVDGKKRMINCQYKLTGDILSFDILDSYDFALPLIIDPVVIAATLSGSNTNLNFGHTAAFDNAGNIYTGGISFGTGYPSSLGAFQASYGGGDSDVCISKYSSDGSQLLYATYLGGNGNDFPHSMITDDLGQLYLYGSTSSDDFPTTANAIQTNFGGAFDIFVTKLNATGSQLVGSTYFGGSSEDGHDMIEHKDNYGDRYRGEIIIDDQGNAYVASNTVSSNFPVTSGTFDSNYNSNFSASLGAQDAVVFKTNSDMSTLYWSSYIGGDGPDTGAGLRLDQSQNIYITGTAGGSNFPNVSGGYQDQFSGNQEDAYVLLLSSDGKELLSSTFFGTAGNDHGYFIDLDEESNVHIYGQSTGIVIPTADTYSTENDSPQFVAAFNPNLTEIVYATHIGTGPYDDIEFQFVPAAFMVDECNNIYLSGYKAKSGLPTTPDALLGNGEQMFYLAVLDPLAKDLSYATYYGNADHVDGGTSRFDKGGTVYQAVCSCPYSNTELNTLPNAWSTQSDLDCDIGVFKIDFEKDIVTASAISEFSGTQTTSGCAPLDMDFTFTGNDAETYEWLFGDGTSSSLKDPSHTYSEAGQYGIRLVATSTFTCNTSDTFYLDITVLDNSSSLQETALCAGISSIYLDASTANASYNWQDGSTSSTYPVYDAGTYWVDISIGSCEQRDSFLVYSATDMTLEIGDDFSICDQNSYTLSPQIEGPVTEFLWSDGSTNSTLEITQSGTYALAVTDTAGCVITDALEVSIGSTPEIELGTYDTLCEGETIVLNAATQSTSYLWQDGSQGATFTVTESGNYAVTLSDNGCTASDEVDINYFDSPSYTTEVKNMICTDDCNGAITIDLTTNTVNPVSLFWNTGDTTNQLTDLCEGFYNLSISDANDCVYPESFEIINPAPLALDLKGTPVVCNGENNGEIEILNLIGGFPPYELFLNEELIPDTNIIGALSGDSYEVLLSDSGGCTLSKQIDIFEPPLINVIAGDDRQIELGDSVHLKAYIFPGDHQNLSWSPVDHFMECLDCPTPAIKPLETSSYVFSALDTITGCIRTDTVMVNVDKVRKVYIPNAFSPNNDGYNDVFKVYGGPDVAQVLSLKIYNRWGAQLFEGRDFLPNDLSQGWDGIFRGKVSGAGVYLYTAEVLFIDGVKILYRGDLSIVK